MHHCLDIEVLSRFVFRSSELEEVLRVETHVRACASCQERVGRLQHYGERLFEDLVPASIDTPAACLSDLQLDHFERNGLVERQMVRVQQHLGECGDCRARWKASRGQSVASPSPLLPRARVPEVDLLAAPEGVRVEGGVEALVRSPSEFLQDLGLQELESRARGVQAERRVRFRLARSECELVLDLDLRSPEGFLLEIGLRRDGAPVEDELLAIWTRTAVVEARNIAHGQMRSPELLAPGHYFVGFSPWDAPLAALSVCNGWLTWQELVICGYDHCTRGAFERARACFAAAAKLSTEPGASFRRLLDAFVSRHGTANTVTDLVQRPEPEDLDLGRFSPADHASLAEIVRWLTERSRPRTAPAHRTPDFRTGFAALLTALRPRIESLDLDGVSIA